MRYAAPYLSNTAEAVVKLNAAIKAAALQFEKLPKKPVQRGGAVWSWVTTGGCPGHLPRLRRGDPGLSSRTTGRRQSGLSCEPCFET